MCVALFPGLPSPQLSSLVIWKVLRRPRDISHVVCCKRIDYIVMSQSVSTCVWGNFHKFVWDSFFNNCFVFRQRRQKIDSENGMPNDSDNKDKTS